ncbi:MAG: patatin-like phospholipase family protein [Emticicia sp.]|uniref:patatin-like phospholipase family protein n=1 Tax=Emticicia sp. TaxID=1930953 RepID=UPI003BA7A067
MPSKPNKNLSNYPDKPFDEIALAFSGGGFRAASFAFGTMSYLNHLTFKGKSLLQRTKFMASASGGTIAVAMYLLSLHRKEDFEQFRKNLLAFMDGEKLLSDAVQMLTDDKNWQHGTKEQNFINAFAKVYDEKLFQLKWENIWALSKSTHIKEVCINTTDFQSGHSFRFQTTEENTRNIIGNRYVNIKDTKEVRQLRVGDLLAASSCFPIGFEPMVFPDDFAENEENKKKLAENIIFKTANNKNVAGTAFGLMDGGITDNQGIESMMLAYDRRNNETAQKKGVKPFDLMIVADVSNRIIAPYNTKVSKIDSEMSINGYHKKGKRLLPFGVGVLILSLVSYFSSSIIGFSNETWVNLSKAFGYLTFLPAIALIVGGRYYKRKIAELIAKIKTETSETQNLNWDILSKYGHFLTTIKISVLSKLLYSRMSSTATMASEVFLKKIRRAIFEEFYECKDYDFRRVSNLIYTLSEGYQNSVEKEEENKAMDEVKLLLPSLEMMKVAENARTTGTTLWFSKKDIDQKRLRDIIATAQFTLCNALLSYFKELEKETKYKDLAEKEELLQLKKQILTDWEAFKENPYYLYQA